MENSVVSQVTGVQKNTKIFGFSSILKVFANFNAAQCKKRELTCCL